MNRRLPAIYEPEPPRDPRPREPSYAGLSQDARRSLVLGAVLGWTAYLIPFTRFIFSYLGTLVHELGHAAAGIALGSPSLPAFDFRYGGGVTRIGERSPLVFACCLLALLWLAARWWSAPRLRPAAVALVIGYGLVAFTPLREMVILAAGHAFELLFAGIFLYRALSGSAIIRPVERPLYAACAVFLLTSDLRFSWDLMTDQDARAAYEMSKGGSLLGDLTRLSSEFLDASLSSTASLLFFGALATPWITYGLFRKNSGPV
ncbi:MAG: hypothetical protein AAF725_03715 [Acidobacteriota bacterium]